MKICIYCSSRDEGSTEYIKQTEELARWIAHQKHSIVFGGATGGLMDTVANTAHNLAGEIIGVIPKSIQEIGRESKVCTQLIEVSNMSQRKDVMQDISDVFVVLPGGIGTLDEIFDTLSKVMLGYFNKKTILVNINGYWDMLIKQLQVMTDTKMGGIDNLMLISNSIEETIELLEKEASIKIEK